MLDIVESSASTGWVEGLRDKRAVARIQALIRSAIMGRFGDTGSVGDGVWEMRIHHGPGYKPYFARSDGKVVLLLCGGDKDSQPRDISLAKRIAAEWRST